MSLYLRIFFSCNGVNENAVGSCAELIFAPIDATFANDAPLLPSIFRIMLYDSLSDDLVDEFERLCEVQSDKATIEITSRFKGKIVQLHFLPGDIVKVGETLLRIHVDDAQESSTLDGEINSGSEIPEICELEPVPESITEIMENIKTAEAKVLSTPSIKHLAKEYGININDFFGTGKDNRVLKEDVL